MSDHLRGTLRRIPAAAWICALVAIVNAVCWSVISPPFQLPDEPDHFAYVQHLAETGHLPSSNGYAFPPAEQTALAYLLHEEVQFSQENQPIASPAEQQNLEDALALPRSRSEPGDAGTAASQPPLYYALETIPYALGSSGTLLDSLALMRLFSALLGGLTALFAFLFLREALPGVRWAWTVGGLGVALTPTLGMMSGAVNPDALLFAVSSALFYCLARGFRRGLTRRLAVATGAAIAIGCMTKLTFLGLVPGAIVGLFVLAIRETRASGRSAYRSLAVAFAVAATPAGLFLIDDALSGRLTLEVISGATSSGAHHGSLLGAVPYIWQLYMPRLPGMSPTFHGISGSWIWFEQLVGKYGWLDTTFPAWVVKVALIPVGLIAVLLVRALVTKRRALRTRGVELAVYVLMSLGVLTIIGVDEYVHRVPNEYLQLRYVLPMIALMGAVLALAARGAGRRWGPVAGTFIVLVILAHDLFSQLLVISRYYG
jgi:4-amino-4-deoxy-L-arabinose transferase-like glycosyltransferase